LLPQIFFPEKTTARSSTGKTLVFSGKVFSAQSRVNLKPVRGLSQVPKGSRPKQKNKKLGQFSAQREALRYPQFFLFFIWAMTVMSQFIEDNISIIFFFVVVLDR
jgi:hypothetical protein